MWVTRGSLWDLYYWWRQCDDFRWQLRVLKISSAHRAVAVSTCIPQAVRNDVNPFIITPDNWNNTGWSNQYSYMINHAHTLYICTIVRIVMYTIVHGCTLYVHACTCMVQTCHHVMLKWICTHARAQWHLSNLVYQSESQVVASLSISSSMIYLGKNSRQQRA